MLLELSENFLYKHAHQLCEKGEFAKALRIYERLEREHNCDWRYSNMQGYCYMHIDKYEAARECFIRSLTQGGLASTIYNNIAWSYIEEEEYEKAINEIGKVIKDFPFDPYIQINLAKSYHGLGQYQEAIEHFKRTIEMQPDFYDAHFGLALCYYRSHNFTKAIPCFEQYLKYHHCLDSLYFLSKSLLKVQNYAEHIKVARQLIEEDEEDIEVLIDRAFSYSQLGSFVKAEKDLFFILDIDPENRKAQELLLQIQSEKK